MPERFEIHVPRWDEFQVSPSKRPKDGHLDWIKSYTRQLSNDVYYDLSFHLRGLLESLRLEYARSRRQLIGTTATLTRRLGHRVLRRDLEALSQAGLITFRVLDGYAAGTTEEKREDKEVRVGASLGSELRPLVPADEVEIDDGFGA